MDKNSKIGVFDSGFGGLSVLRYLVNILPDEDYIYYADSANAPYGRRTPDNVIELSEIAFDKLLSLDVKAIVVACNTTATQFKERGNKEKFNNKNLFFIHPELQEAIDDDRTNNILLMATKVTCKSKFIEKIIKGNKTNKKINVLAAEEIVPFVESGKCDTAEFNDFLKTLLNKYTDIDTVVLGCTHFPFVQEEIKKLLSIKNGRKQIIFFDNAETLSYNVQKFLTEKKLLQDKDNKITHTIEIIDTLNDINRLPLYKQLINNNNFQYFFNNLIEI